jgi:hypothetical protein
VAWGPAVVLAVLLLVGGGALLVNDLQGLPPPGVAGGVLPPQKQGFGWERYVADGEDTVWSVLYGRLGFVWIRLHWPIGRR